MTIPPRPMGTLVDGGQMQGGMDENLPSVDVSIPQVEDFAGGAEVIPQEDGTAVVQALADMIQQAEAEAPMEHNANLAEFLDEGYLGELSSELRAAYEEDQESRSGGKRVTPRG